MHRTFSLSEKTLWFILFFFVKSCLHIEVEAIQGPSVENWCSEKHCKNCEKSEILQCSENAVSSRCGDLCGCCQSCVHLRDLGESCGSQLAVRSPANENFGDTRSRVTIIATSSCKRGLVCTDFVCQRKNEAVDSFNTGEVELHARTSNVQNGFPKADLPTDVIRLKNQSQFGFQHYNHKEVKYPTAGEYEDDARKFTRPTFTAKPLPSLTEMLSKLSFHENEVSKFRESMMPALNQNIIFGTSIRFLNLIIDRKEFQLIYGHDALADLKMLLNSVEKSQTNSFINEFVSQKIFEHFKNLLDYINNNKNKSVTKKETNLYPQILERVENPKNEGFVFSGNFLQAEKFLQLENNGFSGISNTQGPQLLAEQFRSKREIEDAEDSKVYLRMQYKNVNLKEQVDKRANEEFPVYDFVNKAPAAMGDVNKEVTYNVLYSMGFPFLFARIPNTTSSGFRRKRETKDAEEPKVFIETQHKNDEKQNFSEVVNTKQISEKTNSEFPVDDFVNKSSDRIGGVNKKATENVLYSIGFPFLFTRIPNTTSSGFRIGGFRRKRETKDAEEPKVYMKTQYKNSEKQDFHIVNPIKEIEERTKSELPVDDLVNHNSMKDINEEFADYVLHLMRFPLRRYFKFDRIRNTKSPIFQIGGFRRKRDTKDDEEPKVYIETQQKKSEKQDFHEIVNPNKEIEERTTSGLPVDDLVNHNSTKDVNEEFADYVFHSMRFPLRRYFQFDRIPNTKSPIFQIGGFRRKRESKDAEEPKGYIETQYKSSEKQDFHEIVNPNKEIEEKTTSELPVDDLANHNSMKNVNEEFADYVFHLMRFPLQRYFQFDRNPNYKNPLFRIEGFRKKRDPKDAEESKVYVEPQNQNGGHQNSSGIVNIKQINEKINSEFPVNDSANKSSDTVENVNKKVINNVLYSMGFPLRQNFTLARIRNTQSPEFQIGEFRRKRESKDAEEFKIYVGPQDKNSKQPNFHDLTNPSERIYDKSNPKLPVFDFANDTQKMQNIDNHWLVTMDKTAGDKLPINQKMELDNTESPMNIHITGVPVPRNTAENLGLEVKSRKKERERRDELVEEDYGHYDVGLEVFVTKANPEVPAMEAEEDQYNLENFTKVEVSKTYKQVEKDTTNNVTENPGNQSSQFNGNVYQFTFPKTLESDSFHELSIKLNETVEEFRARLDRIEMQVVSIGSSILQHFFELPSNEKRRITGESENSDVSMNANPNGRQMAAMNTQSRNPTSQKANQTRFPKDNSTGRSRHGNWRDFMVLPSLANGPENLRAGRRRPNKIRGNGVDFPQRKLRRKIMTRFPIGSGKKIPGSTAQISSTRKWAEEDTEKFPALFTTPVIFSNADYRNFPEYSSASVQKNQHASKGFSGEQSSYEVDSKPLVNQKILWPLNPAWNKVERNKRTSTPQTSAIEKSIFSLETQIPKPVRSGLSRVSGHQLGGKSLGIRAMVPISTSTMPHSLNDEFSGQFAEKSDDRNLESWVAEPSFNLFIVQDQNSDVRLGESLEKGPPQGFVLPIENIQMVTTQRNLQLNDNWDPIYPEYLDYSEAAQKAGNQEAEVRTTEILENNRKSQRIDYHDRKKRSADSSLLENQEELSDQKKKWMDHVSTDLDPNNAPVNKENMNRSIFSSVFGHVNEKSSEKTISTLPGKRKRRSVQMVDWLRATQEYHERLQQIRTAALKTWLASRDELDNPDLTNVKLFTREIPAYLEKYTPSDNGDDQSSEGNVEGKIYSPVTGDSGESMTNDDKMFGKMIADLSSHFEDRSKENEEQSPEIFSSSVPRKFTIITTGNSTIRIEEMPKIAEDGFQSSVEDQSEQGSMNSEVLAHDVDFIPSETEIFDHMYESVDAEDEEFDYGDPAFVSRLLDEVDIVDEMDEGNSEGGLEATSEDSFHKDEDVENEDEYEDEDEDEVENKDEDEDEDEDENKDEDEDEEDDIAALFSRTKRDSPFFLFKVKGDPAQNVVIWPSNWQHLISRHLKFNRSGSSATKPQKGNRRSYVKLTKVIPKHVPTLETSAKSFSTRALSSSKVSGWR